MLLSKRSKNITVEKGVICLLSPHPNDFVFVTPFVCLLTFSAERRTTDSSSTHNGGFVSAPRGIGPFPSRPSVLFLDDVPEESMLDFVRMRRCVQSTVRIFVVIELGG
ncbi:hypothetical protein AVEN_199435-1 [Araneus ventricosus]|uniref:Uncharacterized protein n=1 Tax=Araneus ventricosus TaxID=182803 RepID=A0A4Y2LZ82_ARAVE|nr:hypothetical protein AVEN_199435-1 [Araneus ventricosus]